MKWAAFLVVLTLAAAGVGLVRFASQPLVLAPNALLQVAPGTTLHRLSRQLEVTGATPNATLLRWSLRLHGRGAALKAGVYQFPGRVTALQLVDKIERGEVSQIAVRLIEGWNLTQYRVALAAEPLLRGDAAAFDAAAPDDGALDDGALIAALGIADAVRALGGDGRHAEGLFFPDTYFVAPHSDARLLLQRAFAQQRTILLQAWATRAPDLPYRTPYEALIMASIIEKETGIGHERPTIAGVFVNRLRSGMRLQTDPTVIYGIGPAFDGNLRRSDLETDTPFNTYTRTGLPPTPIAMPGAAAIQAALHPAHTRALYFVARGDRTHEFSETLDEHNRAVARFQLRR